MKSSRLSLLLPILLALWMANFWVSGSAYSQSTGSVSAGAKVHDGVASKDTTHRIPPPPAINPRGRMLPAKAYADSVEFNTVFGELYPLVQPKQELHAQALKMFTQSFYPRFKSRGVDSLEAWKAIEKTLDPAHDRQAAFAAFRSMFSASELKSYLAFMKTDAGRKSFEVSAELARLRNDQQGYLSRVINAAIVPLSKMQDPVAPKQNNHPH